MAEAGHYAGQQNGTSVLRDAGLKGMVLYGPVRGRWMFTHNVHHTAARCCLWPSKGRGHDAAAVMSVMSRRPGVPRDRPGAEQAMAMNAGGGDTMPALILVEDWPATS
ncbi:hypothetical protein IOCL2690_000008100 [Leishmania lindenbergi]|uniref:Uncharacterized protein n=1 Tax=Leishmania lindenbergi TaxID=651832 RepID=A0AAW3AWZ4_9TRYP